jgi:hypothetical protein
MKKREITSAEPNKGSVTPLASHPMPAREVMSNNRIQDAMQVGQLPGRDDGGSVSAMCMRDLRLLTGTACDAPQHLQSTLGIADQ